MSRPKRTAALITVLLTLSLFTPAAGAHPDGPDPSDLQGPAEEFMRPLEEHDARTATSSQKSIAVSKNLDPIGRGIRNELGVTTDVWAHRTFAYTGTFSTLCSTGDNDSGIWVWNVRNPTKPSLSTVIDSAAGSKANDVKVATMNSGEILVMSNESCDGGPGGFDIYDVANPANPVFLSRVQTDDINTLLKEELGFVDFGVHNLFLFTQGDKDYVAAVVESEFGNFQIFDITDPANPELAGFWGAEQLAFPGIDWVNLDDFDKILEVDAYLASGFGASANRFLHDITITADGDSAYLANWDAGLVLLDISDVSDPQLVSVAIDPTSEDGEVNSHSAWPSEDGSIVVEGEEDFAPFATVFEVTTGPGAGEYPAAEGAITTPIFSLPGSTMAGATVYAGYACSPPLPGFDDPVPPATDSGQIALIQRGGCTFTDKVNNAEAAGYEGVVVFNDAARGDALVVMGGDPVNLPGVFVGHSTGLLIAGVASADDLVIGAPGESVNVTVIPDGWSGLRIWDYSNPANPLLASTVNTVCSANPIDPSCDPAGTYSSHNVIVETVNNRVKAMVSWYSDGMFVFDVTDPYDPVEEARFSGTNELGDPTDFWGVYKIPGKPYIYGSDRNGGLWIFRVS